jgi:hypothetical protein
MRNESEGELRLADVGSRLTVGAPWTDHDPCEKGLSKSISVGTRKMVNYA